MESYINYLKALFIYSVECGKNYESVIYHQVISDLNKETSVAYLQKELEILRANNKKV